MSQPDQSDYSIPHKQGALYGAAAFVASYAAVFALYVYELGEKTSNFSEAFYGNTEVAGWLLYAANNVPLKTTIKFRESSPTNTHTGNILKSVYGSFQAEEAASITESQRTMLNYFFGGPGASTESLDLAGPGRGIGEVTGSMVVPKLVYYAVPLLVLAAAGYLLTRKVSETRTLTDNQRLFTGASIALGYAGLAIVGAMTVFTASTGEIAVSPSNQHSVAPQSRCSSCIRWSPAALAAIRRTESFRRRSRPSSASTRSGPHRLPKLADLRAQRLHSCLRRFDLRPQPTDFGLLRDEHREHDRPLRVVDLRELAVPGVRPLACAVDQYVPVLASGSRPRKRYLASANASTSSWYRTSVVATLAGTSRRKGSRTLVQ